MTGTYVKMIKTMMMMMKMVTTMANVMIIEDDSNGVDHEHDNTDGNTWQ